MLIVTTSTAPRASLGRSEFPASSFATGIAVSSRPRNARRLQPAGRTRSIGTRSLRHVDVANRVVALRNGTIGWSLAGLAFNRGRNRLCLGVALGVQELSAVRHAPLALRTGVRFVEPAEGTNLAAAGPRRLSLRCPPAGDPWSVSPRASPRRPVASSSRRGTMPPVRGARLIRAGAGTARARWRHRGWPRWAGRTVAGSCTSSGVGVDADK